MDANFWKPIGSLTLDDIQSLLGKPERSVLDYKQARNPSHISPEALADDLCAFANNGFGRIVIGADEGDRDDLAQISGFPSEMVRRLRSRIRDASHIVQPAVDVELQEVQISDALSVIVIEARSTSGRGPHQHRGRYLVRSSDGNTPMLHSSVVHAVLMANGHSSERFGPPDSGFEFVTPFGPNGGSGWFFGAQLEMIHPTTEPIFEVFDERGRRLHGAVSSHVGTPSERTTIDLDRIVKETNVASRFSVRRRVEIRTSGRLADFELLRQEPLDIEHLLRDVAVDRLIGLATLAGEMAPWGWFQIAVGLWGNSANEVRLNWAHDTASRREHQHIVERSKRNYLPSELNSAQSKAIHEILWRLDCQLRIRFAVRL